MTLVPQNPFAHRPLVKLAGAGLFLLYGGIAAFAQESIRPSETGALASQARQQTSTGGPYNIKAGPVGINVSASVGLEANDNIGLAEKDREGDLVIRPQINFNSTWKFSELNTFRFNLGIGYSKYLEHSNLDTKSVLLDPGSEVAFDIYVGGVVRLNFHDRFSILQNPIDEPTLSNVARFDRFQNSAGVTAFVDLNDLKLVFGYDHFNFETFDSEFDTLDRQEEQFFASASVMISDALSAGVDASFSTVTYREDFNNSGTTWTGGLFVEATLSNYTKLRASVGYQGMKFDNNGTSGDTSNLEGWYATLTIAQRLNQYWSHSLTAGREARIGLDVNYTEDIFARYQASWRINSRLSAGFEAFWEDANDSGNDAFAERAHRWGGGFSLTWTLGSKLSLMFKYDYVKKDSDLLLRSYYQNVGLLTLNYQF